MLNLDEIAPRSFGFQLGGKTYQIPTLDSIGAAPVLDLIEGGGDATAGTTALFRAILAEHAPEAMEVLTVAQLKALTTAYMRTGNAGESSPSSD